MLNLVSSKCSATALAAAALRPHCNLCGRNSAGTLFVKNGFVLGRCPTCELVYVQNPPPPDELKRLYSFDAGYHTSFRDDDRECRRYLAEARRHYALLRRYRSHGRVLDVGCSAGFFLKVARDHGWEVRGVELSQDTAALAQELYGLPVTVGCLQESTFPRNHFDVVTFWDVLEHVEDPKKTLSIVHRVLRDDGIVVIRTPNIDGLFPRLSYRLAHVLNYWPHPEPPRHLFQFSKKTLTRLLELTGFTLTAMHDRRIPVGYSFGPLRAVLRSAPRLGYSLIFVPAALAGPMLRAGDDIIAIAGKSAGAAAAVPTSRPGQAI